MLLAVSPAPALPNSDRRASVIVGLPVCESFIGGAHGSKENVRTVAPPENHVIAVAVGNVEQSIRVSDLGGLANKDFSFQITPRHSAYSPPATSEQDKHGRGKPLVNKRTETCLVPSTNDNPANDNDPLGDAA